MSSMSPIWLKIPFPDIEKIHKEYYRSITGTNLPNRNTPLVVIIYSAELAKLEFYDR